MTKPTVGQVVHFYSDAVKANPPMAKEWAGRGFNGQESGPYVAIVTQVFPDADGNIEYANLKVFPPFAPPFDEGSVSEGAEKCPGRYWERPPEERQQAVATDDSTIKRMVERFLSWRLPENFNPDCGIHFDADAATKLHPQNRRYEPTGTNLFDYTQAEAMVRHMLGAD